MHAFDYHCPTSLNETERLLGRSAGAKLLAGGQTLIPAIKLRLNQPQAVVDLGRIAGLKHIVRKGDALTIGAMATHADVVESATVKASIPGLAALAQGIGDPQVRNKGTIGGSLANNDPAADYPGAVLALNATLTTNRRRIAADEYFHGPFMTALTDGEILTEISFPIPERFAYAKFPNPASRFALVGVVVASTATGVRVAVTGAGARGVFRVPAFEAALSKSFLADAISGIEVPESALMSDIHADASYRAHLIGVMAERAVEAALA
jgi:carbon-monoxide dehydrogenase medium subunit